MDIWALYQQADFLGKTIALALLAMSIGSWVLIAWKLRLLMGAQRGLLKAQAAFWAAPSWEQGINAVQAFDRRGWLLTLLQAAERGRWSGALSAHVTQADAAVASLEEKSDREHACKRALRTALRRCRRQLHWGQVVLATIGATAPFVGLLGTVLGIYHALLGIGAGGQVSLEKIAHPVGEALVMTAIGLAVALPAVLAYNMAGRVLLQIEAELDGFAHDVLQAAVQGLGARV